MEKQPYGHGSDSDDHATIRVVRALLTMMKDHPAMPGKPLAEVVGEIATDKNPCPRCEQKLRDLGLSGKVTGR
jgi:hypothetical protein